MNVLAEYKLRKDNYDYYSQCLYEECIKGMKVYGTEQLQYADKLRSLDLNAKVRHYKQEMEFIMNNSPEYFI